jgi:hypothetical protein
VEQSEGAEFMIIDIFLFGVVFGFVAIVKRYPSFWIATGLQRAPRNDRPNTNDKTGKRQFSETATSHRVCLRFAKSSSPAKGEGTTTAKR